MLVTPASVSDPVGAAQPLPEVVARYGWLRHFWADRTYTSMPVVGQLREWFPPAWTARGDRARQGGQQGFAVQPHHWIIERTFAWLTQKRRLVRDYEEREVNTEAMILIAASKLMLKRLANYLH